MDTLYNLYKCPKNMLHFKTLIKTLLFFFLFCYIFMRSYADVYVIFIKGHIIIIHGITCFSNDIIDDVIKFAKFSV